LACETMETPSHLTLQDMRGLDLNQILLLESPPPEQTVAVQ
jgi:hypothetical protein